jgi:SAM-dependent methyltransferase
MSFRLFRKKVRLPPAAPIKESVVDDPPCEGPEPISEAAPERVNDGIRGTHPLVKPREESRLHREVISPQLGLAGLTLEIGPYFHPVVKGPNARYFDVFDTEELKKRADEDPNPIVMSDTVPVMHYWDPHGDISIIPETFVEIFSSHCLEHQPDLVSHFEKVYDLLKPGGRYIAFVPDKRFCFDHFGPYSSVGDVLQAFAEKRTRHTLASLVNLIAGGTHNFPGRHWAGDHAEPDYISGYPDRVTAALEVFKSANGGYIDCHAWRFKPDSLAEICDVLYRLGRMRLRVVEIGDTRENTQEFTVIFVKDRT